MTPEKFKALTAQSIGMGQKPEAFTFAARKYIGDQAEEYLAGGWRTYLPPGWKAPEPPRPTQVQRTPGPPPPPLPTHGPGIELKKLIMELGFQWPSVCACNSRAAQMDIWGVEESRKNRAQIIEWLWESADQMKWFDLENAKAAWKMRGQSWFKYTDPVGSMVDQAISREEERLNSSSGIGPK